MYPPPSPQPGVPYGQPVGMAFDPRIVPPPPRLHWGWVLALSVLTRGLFNSVWLIVQAAWIRRVTGNDNVLWLAIAHVALIPVIFVGAIIFGFALVTLGGGQHSDHGMAPTMVGIVIVLLILTLYCLTVFRMKEALESPQIGLTLSGVMTLLFSAIYFQYFLRDYAVMSPVEVYGQMPAPPGYVPPPPPPL